MVEFSEIDELELPSLVLLSYEGDQDLFDKFHVGKKDFKQAVISTLEMINEAKQQIELTYYKVLFGNEPIGYLVVSGKFIHSFAVAIKFRCKEIMNEWWDKLRGEFGDFSIGLLSNNIRAIKFVQKRGMKIAWENPEHKEINEVILNF